ncbi:MAG: hypothetical protein ABI679_09145 [Gemmatimonadota bacterium]
MTTEKGTAGGTLFAIGRVLFGTGMVAFGAIPLFTRHLPGGLVPLSTPLPVWLAVGIGILLIVTTVAALIRPASRMPYVLAAFPLVSLLAAHAPTLYRSGWDAGLWSGGFEVVSLGAGALMLAGLEPGRWIYAVSIAFFGVVHLMYSGFIATLVPHWIPVPLFWAYAVGVAFLAAALSIFFKIAIRLSGTLLGLMFLSWVFVVHLPRIVGSPGIEAEWTSGFVALAMSGIAWMTTRNSR